MLGYPGPQPGSPRSPSGPPFPPHRAQKVLGGVSGSEPECPPWSELECISFVRYFPRFWASFWVVQNRTHGC